MRGFCARHRGLLVWLAADGAALAAFFLLRAHRAVMNACSARVAMPLERALGALCARAPFSVGEWLYALAILAVPVYLVGSAFAVRRAARRGETACVRLMGLAAAALTAYAAFCLLWGVNFYADGFQEKSGVAAAPVAREELIAVTRYFAEQTAACADDVPRDADGAFAVPREEILAYAPALYEETMYTEFPFLRMRDDPVKRLFFSRLMSEMNFTGVYIPFTGESCLNTDFPADQLPATVAHELAHRRGLASEQECNFVAVLAASRSENAAYRYSGYLMGYIHLSNALYAADRAAWREIAALLPAAVNADLEKANAYWAQFETPVAEASDRAYDAMLKSYGHALGTRSYGAVVDLLVAYYK